MVPELWNLRPGRSLSVYLKPFLPILKEAMWPEKGIKSREILGTASKGSVGTAVFT